MNYRSYWNDNKYDPRKLTEITIGDYNSFKKYKFHVTSLVLDDNYHWFQIISTFVEKFVEIATSKPFELLLDGLNTTTLDEYKYNDIYMKKILIYLKFIIKKWIVLLSSGYSINRIEHLCRIIDNMYEYESEINKHNIIKFDIIYPFNEISELKSLIGNFKVSNSFIDKLSSYRNYLIKDLKTDIVDTFRPTNMTLTDDEKIYLRNLGSVCEWNYKIESILNDIYNWQNILEKIDKINLFYDENNKQLQKNAIMNLFDWTIQSKTKKRYTLIPFGLDWKKLLFDFFQMEYFGFKDLEFSFLEEKGKTYNGSNNLECFINEIFTYSLENSNNKERNLKFNWWLNINGIDRRYVHMHDHCYEILRLAESMGFIDVAMIIHNYFNCVSEQPSVFIINSNKKSPHQLVGHATTIQELIKYLVDQDSIKYIYLPPIRSQTNNDPIGNPTINIISKKIFMDSLIKKGLILSSKNFDNKIDFY